MEDIKRNLLVINQKIDRACKIYQKDRSKVNLIAVSKKMATDKIQQAIAAGQIDFGENYIQEAKEKWPQIKKDYPNLKLHFIGNFQSKKAKEIVELFDCIHTLSSQSAAESLKKEMSKSGKDMEILVQVNIGDEDQKGGIELSKLQEFIKYCHDIDLKISGLMCIPPSGELASPYFALLNKYARENNLQKLSMGMSADFEEAIAMDSNYIRVGTAIFGPRD